MIDRRFHAVFSRVSKGEVPIVTSRNKMSHNKRCYVKKINKSVAQGSRRVDLMFKQASLKAFTSDFDVCDKDLGIDSISSATCIKSNESVHQPNLF